MTDELRSALEGSPQIAHRLHTLSADVAAYAGGEWTGWDELDEYDQFHYAGAADLIAWHLVVHGTDHLDWLAQRVHEARMNKVRDRRWDELDPEERQLAVDLVAQIIQGDNNGKAS